MEHDTFYPFSKWLRTVMRSYQREELLGFQAYRYAIFVDSSPRGKYCKYAAACLKFHKLENEGPALATFLRELSPPVPKLDTYLEMINEN